MDSSEIGERIAYYAESFIGTPYDTNSLGAYVTNKVIIYDSAIDCMYHVFRSVELAMADSYNSPVELALEKRFLTHGILDNLGRVVNYDERFQYAEDMIYSCKWGVNITGQLSVSTIKIKGDRGIDNVEIIEREKIPKIIDNLRSGDIIYFVKSVEKRVVGEIIGHLGIIKKEGGQAFLIHASGKKNINVGGEVKKVSFVEYCAQMAFIGINVTRFL
ncbi:MAG: DUF1460 domain-containing protein [Nitrospirae bacterium]|nr:DUF1460 domain-containing protein [Nitrospirota bacterium]